MLRDSNRAQSYCIGTLGDGMTHVLTPKYSQDSVLASAGSDLRHAFTDPHPVPASYQIPLDTPVVVPTFTFW